MDLISYWSNVNDEEDDEFNDSLTENATPLAALVSFCYILMSVLAINATPSSIVHLRRTQQQQQQQQQQQKHHHQNPWWQTLLENHLQVRAEYTLQIFFLIASILLFAAEELKTHKLMRSLRRQQRTSQWCFIISLHLFWLSVYGLYKLIPKESDISKEKTTDATTSEAPSPNTRVTTEGSLEKCGRICLVMGTTIELCMMYVEYFSQAKVPTGSLLMGTFVSALLRWTNALLVAMTERYYYPDWLDNHRIRDEDAGKMVDLSFEDAMNLPDRLRQRMQAHQRRHLTHIRVV